MEKEAKKVLKQFLKSLNNSTTFDYTTTAIAINGRKAIKVEATLKIPPTENPSREKLRLSQNTFAVFFDNEGMTIYDKTETLRLSVTWAFCKTFKDAAEAPTTAP